MSDLRDHSNECEHASQRVLSERPGKWFSPDGGGWQCSLDSCPGGQEVTDSDMVALLVSRGWTVIE